MKYRVDAIMRADFPTLAPGTPIRRAVAALVDAGAAAAPVIEDDGNIVGILTQKDCFRPVLLASYHREWTGKVSDHMSRDVIWVNPDDEMIRVAEMFIERAHRVFPVLEGHGVIGMLYRSDVLAFLTRIG